MSWSSANELSVSDGSGDPPEALGQSAGASRVTDDLVEALRRGDPSAMERLVVRYGDEAYRLAIGIVRDAPDAEQVVYDAFSMATQRMETLGSVSVRSWLYGIVAEAAFRRRRHGVRPATALRLDDLLPVFHEDGEEPVTIDDWSRRLDEPAIQSDLHSALGSALETLTLEDRAIVLLRDVEGLPVGDVATTLAMGVHDVRSRLHRARLLLRHRLATVMTAV